MPKLKAGSYALLSAALLTIIVLLAATGFRGENPAPFHDFLMMMPGDYQELVDPYDEEVKRRARKFKSMEEAFLFVRDQVSYLGSATAAKPGQTLRDGYGSCLGKAALLCSLYRAMGVDEFSVRVVTGIVDTPAGLTEHAWVDLELDGMCYQQDASGFLGAFSFSEFPGQSYIDRYVVREIMIFNDEDFGIVSQRNRMKGNM